MEMELPSTAAAAASVAASEAAAELVRPGAAEDGTATAGRAALATGTTVVVGVASASGSIRRATAVASRRVASAR